MGAQPPGQYLLREWVGTLKFRWRGVTRLGPRSKTRLIDTCHVAAPVRHLPRVARVLPPAITAARPPTLTPPTMASANIQALLAPPSEEDSNKRTRDYFNARFKTFEELEDSQDFDDLVASTSTRNDELEHKVRRPSHLVYCILCTCLA